MKQKQQTILVAWASYLKKQKDTSALIITVDEDSDDDEQHHTATTMPTFIVKPMNLLLGYE